VPRPRLRNVCQKVVKVRVGQLAHASRKLKRAADDVASMGLLQPRQGSHAAVCGARFVPGYERARNTTTALANGAAFSASPNRNRPST
jgi:hypothetical protein